MRRSYIIIALTLACLVAITVLPCSLQAQTGKQPKDFRGQSYTEDDLARALFGEGESQMRTRGIAPVQTSAPGPVALNVFFEFNSATIRPEYYADLDKLGRVLTQPKYMEYHIKIDGHTDSVGSESYNQRLSERRAMSVKQYLVQHFNVQPQRLTTRGYGESQPMATNATDEGRSKNRRVQVENLGKQ
jgi:outer membrane protein OmpA-like peptidoglycan-associated protein